MKNIQQFSLVSWSPAPFTSFLMPEMIFSTSSSAKSPGISPEARRSLISTRKLSSGTCASVKRNTVPMFFKPAFWHKFARSSWPKGEKRKTNSKTPQVRYSVCFTLALRQFRRKSSPVHRPYIFSFENVERAYKNREAVTKKNTLYLSVNVFSTKVLTGGTIFTSPSGDRSAILRGHPSHAKV